MILGDVRGEGHSYEYSAQHMLRISTRADISRAVTPTHELSRFKSAITQEERKREREREMVVAMPNTEGLTARRFTDSNELV